MFQHISNSLQQKERFLQDLTLSLYFQPASLSHSTILPPYLFTELLLRHVQHPLHLAPIVDHFKDGQRSLQVARRQILKGLVNPEPTTSVKEVFDVVPLALSQSILGDIDAS